MIPWNIRSKYLWPWMIDPRLVEWICRQNWKKPKGHCVRSRWWSSRVRASFPNSHNATRRLLHISSRYKTSWIKCRLRKSAMPMTLPWMLNNDCLLCEDNLKNCRVKNLIWSDSNPLLSRRVVHWCQARLRLPPVGQRAPWLVLRCW